MKIALVSKEGAALNAYRQFFEAEGIDLVHLPSISELFQKLTSTVISGFVVDIQMALKTTDLEKRSLQTLETIFPNVRTNWNPEMGFRVLYNKSSGSSDSEMVNLSVFLEDCRKFKPRAMRKHERKEINCHVLFWPADLPEEEAERAYTLNISGGGLFVCTCNAPPVDKLVWVSLQGVDLQPFKVLVRMTRAWGTGRHVPGFGGSYQDPDATFTEKLEVLLRRA